MTFLRTQKLLDYPAIPHCNTPKALLSRSRRDGGCITSLMSPTRMVFKISRGPSIWCKTRLLQTRLKGKKHLHQSPIQHFWRQTESYWKSDLENIWVPTVESPNKSGPTYPHFWRKYRPTLWDPSKELTISGNCHLPEEFFFVCGTRTLSHP